MKITSTEIEFSAEKPKQTAIYPQIGSILLWGGDISSNVELGDYLLCDGNPYSITEYTELFKIMRYKYGGSGATFNVPDLKKRIPIGADDTKYLTYKNESIGGVNILEDAHYPHTHVLTFNETAFENRRGAETKGGNRGTTYSYGTASLTINIPNNNNLTETSKEYYPRYCIVNYIVRAK